MSKNRRWIGAFAGALSSIPLAIVGYQLDVGAGGDEFLGGALGALAGAAVGWVIVQPLISTAAWHLTKQPRLQAVAPPLARARTRAPGQVTLTLLRAGF
jgi:hypothetical protein